MGGSASTGREENGENQESSDTALARESSATALTMAVIAGAAILALGAGVVSLMGYLSKSSEEKTMEDPVTGKKTMKPPGRDGGSMLRKDFEDDPGHYFQKLRSNKRKEKSLATK